MRNHHTFSKSRRIKANKINTAENNNRNSKNVLGRETIVIALASVLVKFSFKSLKLYLLIFEGY